MVVLQSGNAQRSSSNFSATTKDSRKKEKKQSKSVESLKWLLDLMLRLIVEAEVVDHPLVVVDRRLEVEDHPLEVVDRRLEEITPQKLVRVFLMLTQALEALRDPVEAFLAMLTMTGASTH